MSILEREGMLFLAYNYSFLGLNCGVCMTDVEESNEMVTVFGCGHKFHCDCIGQWVADHNSCPSCNKPVLIFETHKAVYIIEEPLVRP